MPMASSFDVRMALRERKIRKSMLIFSAYWIFFILATPFILWGFKRDNLCMMSVDVNACKSTLLGEIGNFPLGLCKWVVIHQCSLYANVKYLPLRSRKDKTLLMVQSRRQVILAKNLQEEALIGLRYPYQCWHLCIDSSVAGWRSNQRWCWHCPVPA